MASQLEKMKKKGREKEGLSRNTRENAVGLDARYGSGNMVAINIDLLEPNENNLREVEDDEGLASLMQSIEDVGLQQNLVAYQIGRGENKHYRLLSGHRRFRALKKLHEKYPEENKYCLIPCLIVQPAEDKEKGISFELAEKMFIAVTNVEVEGLSRKELMHSIRICMEYYEKKHAGEKRLQSVVKGDTASKLGISQRMLYDLLKIDANLIPELQEAYFEENVLQHRAARKLAAMPRDVQTRVWQSAAGHLEQLSEEEINRILKDTKEQQAAPKKKKSSIDPFTVKLNYQMITDDIEKERFSEDINGRRIMQMKKLGRGEETEISPEKEIKLLAPENIKHMGIKFGKADYAKYIKAMNTISKEMAVIAELIENKNNSL